MGATFNYAIRWPGDALFGAGRSDLLGEEIRSRGHRRALIVTDPGLRVAGVLARIERSLDRADIAHAAYAEVRPNPTTDNVDEAYALWRDGGFDAVIALGGGSSMDTAKGLMARAISGLATEEAYGADIDVGANPAPPFYCLPTTSGTGSESSMAAVLKSKDRKFVIRGARLRPAVVIMDPELTLSLPPRMTAMTGFEAYCHAIGAWANNQVNPIIDELALHAMRLLLASLPKAVEDGENLAAREAVMTGSYLAGVAIGQKGVDGIHGLCTPVESLADLVHGEVLGVIMPHMLGFNVGTQERRYSEAARRLGLADDSMCDAEAAGALIEASMMLKDVTGGASHLSELGLSEEMIPRLVEMALSSQATQRNGRPLSPESIGSLYAAMM